MELVLTDRKVHCQALVDLLAARGVTAAMLTGDLSPGERLQVVVALNAGRGANLSRKTLKEGREMGVEDQALKTAALWAGAGMPLNSSDLSTLARLEGEKIQASAARDVASLHATGQVEAAKQYGLRKRATGGPVEDGQPYLVGERGPEVYVPDRSLSDLAPARRSRESGRWEDLGGGLQATTGPGVFDRPTARQVIPKSLNLSDVAPGNKVAMESGQWVHQPVQVLRGTKSSFAGGPAGQEWTSLEKAAAAGRGEGMFTVGELTHQRNLEAIAAHGRAAKVASGKGKTDEETAHDYLTNMLLPQHGTGEKDVSGKPTGNRVLSPYAEAVRLKHLPYIKTIQDVPKVLGQIGPELEAAKQISILDTEASRAKMLANYRLYQQSRGLASDPAQEKFFFEGMITPENRRFYQSWLNLGSPKTAATGGQPSLETTDRLGASEPIEIEPLTGTGYGRHTGRVLKQPSLADLAKPLGRLVFGTPEEWRRAYEAEGRAKKKWESLPDLQRAARSIPAMAEGGDAEKDQPYLVGEKGPEVFVPETDGTVIPNSSLDLSNVARWPSTPALPSIAPMLTGPGVRQSEYDEVSLGGKG